MNYRAISNTVHIFVSGYTFAVWAHNVYPDGWQHYFAFFAFVAYSIIALLALGAWMGAREK